MKQKNDVILKNQKNMKAQIAALVEKYQKFDKVLARAEKDIAHEEQIAKVQERKVIKLRSDESDFAEVPDEGTSDQAEERDTRVTAELPLDGEEHGTPIDIMPEKPKVQHTVEEIEKLQNSIEQIMGQKLQIGRVGEDDDDKSGSDVADKPDNDTESAEIPGKAESGEVKEESSES